MVAIAMERVSATLYVGVPRLILGVCEPSIALELLEIDLSAHALTTGSLFSGGSFVALFFL
ncbi:hypothetical protein AXF42_Ash001717 [Apostasia shenzhenica]|uniref:Uncharacterized protein n=1 Tax=Apostasia shenzhenica TaxID=1088818 RepID=A0A2I0AB44_9ASPA|nr:hypothetical protein AXF42_Ash001717 [Apostasia shenzhenica]